MMAIFTDVICDVTKEGRKLPTNEYKEIGRYPIIDQGQNQIAGYTDETDGLFSDVPAIIFGDHTRIIKYVDEPFFIGADGVKILKAKDEKANYKFLYYALSSAKIPNTGYNRHFKWLKEIDIPEYTIEEQNSIVAQLEKVDTLIYLRKQQLSKLDELVKSRFIEMFGDPISNPNGLPVKTLKQLSTLITNGNTPKGGSENYVNEGILFIRSQNVWRNRIDLDDVAYIDKETHRSLRKSSLKYKDILITKTGRINTENSSLGRAALFLGEDNSANINGHVYLVRLDGSVVPEYVISILTSEAYRKYIRKVCVGGIDKRQINLDQVEDFPIILPSIDLQNQFAEFVEQTDKLKFEVQQSLDKLETMKKALMQKYFG